MKCGGGGGGWGGDPLIPTVLRGNPPIPIMQGGSSPIPMEPPPSSMVTSFEWSQLEGYWYNFIIYLYLAQS